MLLTNVTKPINIFPHNRSIFHTNRELSHKRDINSPDLDKWFRIFLFP